MKVCILSDLHMSQAGGGQNDFHFTDSGFAATLRDFANIYDWVILNGDIFEMWKPAFDALPQTEKLFNVITSGWRDIFDVINKTRNILVLTGNHDSSVSLEGWLSKARTEVLIPELSLFVAHGHQGDREWCSDSSTCLGFVRLLACCAGTEEMLIDPNFDKAAREIQGLANKKTGAELAQYAFAVAKKLNVGIVCLGHTHHAELIQREGRVYVNCGKCLDSAERFDFVVVQNTDAGVLVTLNAMVSGNVQEQTHATVGVPEKTAVQVLALKETAVKEMAMKETMGHVMLADLPVSQYAYGVLKLVGTQVVTAPDSFLA